MRFSAAQVQAALNRSYPVRGHPAVEVAIPTRARIRAIERAASEAANEHDVSTAGLCRCVMCLFVSPASLCRLRCSGGAGLSPAVSWVRVRALFARTRQVLACSRRKGSRSPYRRAEGHIAVRVRNIVVGPVWRERRSWDDWSRVGGVQGDSAGTRGSGRYYERSRRSGVKGRVTDRANRGVEYKIAVSFFRSSVNTTPSIFEVFDARAVVPVAAV